MTKDRLELILERMEEGQSYTVRDLRKLIPELSGPTITSLMANAAKMGEKVSYSGSKRIGPSNVVDLYRLKSPAPQNKLFKLTQIFVYYIEAENEAKALAQSVNALLDNKETRLIVEEVKSAT